MYHPDAVKMIELAQELQDLAQRVEKHANRGTHPDDELLKVGREIRQAKSRLSLWADTQLPVPTEIVGDRSHD